MKVNFNAQPAFGGVITVKREGQKPREFITTLQKDELIMKEMEKAKEAHSNGQSDKKALSGLLSLIGDITGSTIESLGIQKWTAITDGDSRTGFRYELFPDPCQEWTPNILKVEFDLAHYKKECLSKIEAMIKRLGIVKAGIEEGCKDGYLDDDTLKAVSGKLNPMFLEMDSDTASLALLLPGLFDKVQ